MVGNISYKLLVPYKHISYKSVFSCSVLDKRFHCVHRQDSPQNDNRPLKIKEMENMRCLDFQRERYLDEMHLGLKSRNVV